MRNLLKILNSKIWIFGIILWIAIIIIPSYYFFELDLVIWNFWYNYYIFEMVLTIWISILFWLFLGSTFYKIKSINNQKWLWMFGWFLGVLVSWCPSCSITFASYLGLWSIISIFPYWWIELKIISFLILLYVVFTTIKNLDVCKIK